ncbi:MAG TPA: SDR family oxidoreductase [Pseudonocardiaceae bacterium]|nr:SDR family oxidoreductase [Pseudonocardiaceae bacterium]
MKIAVAGGTGLVGRHLVGALRRNGHEPVVVARSTGADAVTGDGLVGALAGAQVVIDVTSTASTDADEASEFFTTVTKNLMRAEDEVGVGHHVGKLHQEEAAFGGPVPVSVLRATQFFEFAEMVVGWTRQGDIATVPPLLIQPASARDIAAELADLAAGAPMHGTVEVAGPRREDFVDLTRRILTARGQHLEPAWGFGPFHTDMAGDVLLPDASGRTTPPDLDTWLASE